MPIVARGAVNLRDQPTGLGRRPLFGSLDELREDVDRYREVGLTKRSTGSGVAGSPP
jgi:hypothetical protein